MSVPDYQSLMLPVLLAASRGEVRIGDVVDTVADQLGLTPEQRGERISSGRQTLLSNRIHWAKSYLVKAGLVEITRRAHFRITGRGQEILRSNPDRIDNRLLSQFSEFLEFTKRTVTDSDVESPAMRDISTDDGRTPEEIMRVSHKQIESTLAQELLDRVLVSPPDFFERLLVNLLLNMGYGGSGIDAGRVLGRSGDGGIDAVIDQDALGLDRVYVQAKRYAVSNTVGSPEIRDFLGGLDHRRATKGLFVTTSGFSASAREAAKSSSKHIVLIEGRQLTQLMIRYNVGCRVEDTMTIKRLDEEFFE